MKIPDYVATALRRRAKSAQSAFENDLIVTDFINRHNIKVNKEDISGGSEVYASPYKSAERVYNAILKHEEEKDKQKSITVNNVLALVKPKYFEIIRGNVGVAIGKLPAEGEVQEILKEYLSEPVENARLEDSNHLIIELKNKEFGSHAEEKHSKREKKTP